MADNKRNVNNDPIRLFTLGWDILFGVDNGQETPQEDEHQKDSIETTGESAPCQPCSAPQKSSCK